jgi:hypothetical protein
MVQLSYSAFQIGQVYPIGFCGAACACPGGGDQLYNDPVWELESLRAWLKIPDVQVRTTA